MYERIFDFNKLRAQFVEDFYQRVSQSKNLLPEDLIQHQRNLAMPFVGFRETKVFDGPVVDAFQEYTRSQGLSWGVSFIVYVVNRGIGETLASTVDLQFPTPLPITPFTSEFKDLPKSTRPLAGDILVSGDCAWFVSRLKKDSVVCIGMFPKGKKHGVYEKEIIPQADDFFVDMESVYYDFLKKASDVTQEKAESA